MEVHSPSIIVTGQNQLFIFAGSWEATVDLPLEISEFSLTPPQSDKVTSGRSPAESDRHSVPLSAAALPTDWGDWEPELLPVSTQFFGSCSDSLKHLQEGGLISQTGHTDVRLMS